MNSAGTKFQIKKKSQDMETTETGKAVQTAVVCGMSFQIAGHPFDTLKTRMQTMAIVGKGGTRTIHPQLYNNSFDCLRKTLRFEGMAGLYKGFGVTVLGTLPLAMVHSVTLRYEAERKGHPPPSQRLFLTTCMIFITTSFLTPSERIKCLMQIQTGRVPAINTYRGSLDCYRQLCKQGGRRELFRGFGSTYLRGFSQAGLWLALYPWVDGRIQAVYKTNQSKGSPYPSTITGVLIWIATIPIDAVKTRYQTAPVGSYRGYRDAIRHMRGEGPRVFFRGLIPMAFRAIFSNMATFGAITVIAKLSTLSAPVLTNDSFDNV